MKLLEVRDGVSGCGQDQVLVKACGEAEIISFIGKKRGDSSGGIRGVIISKLSDGEQIQPIVLLVVAVYSEVLLQGLIHLFGLSITFGVITGGEVELHVQGFP